MALGRGDERHFPKPNARSHTDNLCCVLLIACVLALVGVVGYAWRKGDSRRLTHGFDYRARLCGVDKDTLEQRYVYYCGAQGAWAGEFPLKLNFDSKTCVASCPSDNSRKIPCLTHAFHNFTEFPGVVQKRSESKHSLTFVSTLNLEIAQSVSLQTSYPTSYRGNYCVPQYRDNITLMEDLLKGPMRRVNRITVAVGSFRRAWPVVLLAAVCACVLGLAYLYVLRSFAGPLIFGSLCIGTALLFILGLFFLIGMFFNPWNEEGGYQQLNPLFRYFYGVEAAVFSVIVGLLLLTAGGLMAFTTLHSAEKIDESIGIIQAACDCIFSPGPGKFDLLSEPVLKGLGLLILVVLALLGFMLATSVGYVDEGIWLNGKALPSLQKRFRYHSWWKPVMLFYAAGVFWLIEYVIALGHFVVSYAVCLWFFVEIEEGDNPEPASKPFQDAYTGNLKRVDNVRVHGVDNVEGGERPGYIERGPAGKVLVVPIGKRGPGGRDFLQDSHKVDKKEMRLGSVLQGLTCGLYYHSGSLALGALVVTFTRPFRWIAHTLKATLGRPEDLDEERGNRVLIGLSLLAGLVEHLFGGYSKVAYCEIVLSSTPFFQSASVALDFITKAGGIVAFLHGSTALYEMIGVACITMLCGGLTFLLLTQLPCYAEPESAQFVSDPWMMTVLSSGIACMLAFGFMAVFNVTADTLLYVFAWCRWHHAQDIRKYCPSSLRELVGEVEMDYEPEQRQLQRSNLNYIRHAANRYAGSVMTSMRNGQGAEQRPLLPTGPYG